MRNCSELPRKAKPQGGNLSCTSKAIHRTQRRQRIQPVGLANNKQMPVLMSFSIISLLALAGTQPHHLSNSTSTRTSTAPSA
jgi:hypothetical protein